MCERERGRGLGGRTMVGVRDGNGLTLEYSPPCLAPTGLGMSYYLSLKQT